MNHPSPELVKATDRMRQERVGVTDYEKVGTLTRENMTVHIWKGPDGCLRYLGYLPARSKGVEI